MSEPTLVGLYCVNIAGRIGRVTGVERTATRTTYVGEGIDGLHWQSDAPLVLRHQEQIHRIAGDAR